MFRTFQPPPGFSEKVEFSEEQLFIEDLNSDDKELWLFQAPQEFDISTLKNKPVSMQGETVFQNEDCLVNENVHKMSVFTSSENELLDYQLLLPSRSKSGLFIAALPFVGQVNLTEYVNRSAPLSLLSSPGKEKEAVSGLRQRYFPFGSSEPLITPKHRKPSKDSSPHSNRKQTKSKRKKKSSKECLDGECEMNLLTTNEKDLSLKATCKSLLKPSISDKDKSIETPVSAKKKVTFKTPLTETQEQNIHDKANNSTLGSSVSPASRQSTLNKGDTFQENESPQKDKSRKKKHGFPYGSELGGSPCKEQQLISRVTLQSEEVGNPTDGKGDSHSLDAQNLNNLSDNNEASYDDGSQDDSAVKNLKRKSKKKKKYDKSLTDKSRGNENIISAYKILSPLSSIKHPQENGFFTISENSQQKHHSQVVDSSNLTGEKAQLENSDSQCDVKHKSSKKKKRNSKKHADLTSESETDLVLNFQPSNMASLFQTNEKSLLTEAQNGNHQDSMHLQTIVNKLEAYSIQNNEKSDSNKHNSSADVHQARKMRKRENYRNFEHFSVVDSKPGASTFIEDNTNTDNREHNVSFSDIQQSRRKLKRKKESADTSHSRKKSKKQKVSGFLQKSNESEKSILVSEEKKPLYNPLPLTSQKCTKPQNTHSLDNKDNLFHTQGKSPKNNRSQNDIKFAKSKKKVKQCSDSSDLATLMGTSATQLAQCERKVFIKEEDCKHGAAHLQKVALSVKQADNKDILSHTQGKSPKNNHSQNDIKFTKSKKKMKQCSDSSDLATLMGTSAVFIKEEDCKHGAALSQKVALSIKQEVLSDSDDKTSIQKKHSVSVFMKTEVKEEKPEIKVKMEIKPDPDAKRKNIENSEESYSEDSKISSGKKHKISKKHKKE